MTSNGVIRISPVHFVHVLDLNTNITCLVSGPQSLILQTNERLVAGPLPLVIVPPGHYCVVKNPIKKYVAGKSCDLRLGETEIRFHNAPFALYPGEELDGVKLTEITDTYKAAFKTLPTIALNHALKLRARVDHKVDDVMRLAGDIWQLEGPCTYYPTPEVEILEKVNPVVIKTGQVLRLRARQDCCDKQGSPRVTGEEWIVKQVGAYLPGTFEKVLDIENATVLTIDSGLHLRATQNVLTTTESPNLKRLRMAGEEWLMTNKDAEIFYPEIGVEVLREVKRTVLSKGQYCIVLNPVHKEGRPQLGQKELRKGLDSFFLHPGETLLDGIQTAHLLTENEAVIVKAIDTFTEDISTGVTRVSGDRWMINGPCVYIPPIQVQIIKKRERIALEENEGIYIQDIQTGAVRDEKGPQSYMLTEFEELWEKPLSELEEELLRHGGGIGSEDIRKLAYFEQSIDPQILQGRDKSKVVTYRCPGNTAVQVYNYQKKTSRVIFGPELVILGPHENFNVLSLSAGKPKKPDALQSICLMLGPDFITDIIEVETLDHARLRLQIAFNNQFEYTKGDTESEMRIFAIPDFIGFACRQVASCIRASVAQTTFDEFHRNSSQIIQAAIFGHPPKPLLRFPHNNMIITSIDIQSIEPSDIKMRDSLMKSVQMAIEIATSSIEAAAMHEAKRMEQAARGKLEGQKLKNEKEAEKARIALCELRAVTSAVESTGQAIAEAQAEAEKARIECTSEIEVAKLKALAEEISHYSHLDVQDMRKSSELSYQSELDSLEVEKVRKMTAIEVKKFGNVVTTLGADTIAAIATSGPENELKMLKSLGLESVLLTDGNSPINLFNTGKGLIGQA